MTDIDIRLADHLKVVAEREGRLEQIDAQAKRLQDSDPIRATLKASGLTPPTMSPR